MSVLVCQITEIDNNTIETNNQTNKQVILSIKNEKDTLTSSQCNIQDLCEQLPAIMQQLMQTMEDKTCINEIIHLFL